MDAYRRNVLNPDTSAVDKIVYCVRYGLKPNLLDFPGQHEEVEKILACPITRENLGLNYMHLRFIKKLHREFLKHVKIQKIMACKHQAYVIRFGQRRLNNSWGRAPLQCVKCGIKMKATEEGYEPVIQP